MDDILRQKLTDNIRRARQALRDMEELIELMRDAKEDVSDLERQMNDKRRQVINWSNALQKRGYIVS